MTETFDFAVAGGSIAGLAFASEAAKRGAKVLVFEEHGEIGEPEKCDGLVSLRGLRKCGYEPKGSVIQSRVATAVIHPPAGGSFEVNAASLEVVVLDRSAYDKQVGEAAVSNGALVRTGSRVTSALDGKDGVEVRAGGETVRAKYYVDATGPASSPKGGILPAAKYEIEGDWFKDGAVEVFLDAARYPGFFAWVIPHGRRAKVGAAGHGISPFRALDAFLQGRPSRILRKVSAPIYIGGPSPRFVEGRKIYVGESAGQVKPTTAGGITTSLAGAVSAARGGCASLQSDDPRLLVRYQSEWEAEFSKEMKSMMRLRGVFEKLSNPDLERIVAALSASSLAAKLSRTDFDFHASALFAALGVKGLLTVARVVASAEARSLLVGG